MRVRSYTVSTERLTVLTVALLLILSMSALARADAPDAQSEVPHVQNAAIPSGGIETVKLKELWRVGGEDDEVFFGVVGRVLTDDKGNIYLLDSQLSEVQVYSPDGEHLHTLGREGEGPGEVRQPGDMFFTSEDHLALIQAFPGKVVMIDLKGTPAGSFTVGGSDPSQGRFSVLVDAHSRGEYMLMTGIRMSMSGEGLSDQTYFLSRCSTDGSELQTYATKAYQLDYANLIMDEEGLDFVWGRWDVSGDGLVYTAPQRNQYMIEVHRPDGTLLHVIEREYENWSRDDEEKRQARMVLQAIANNYPVPANEIRTLDTEPDITGLHSMEEGSLWVRTSRGDRAPGEGILTTYDVFDKNGSFVRQVALAAPGDARQDAIHLLHGERVVVVTQALQAFRNMQGVTDEAGEEDEETPMEVICYTFER